MTTFNPQFDSLNVTGGAPGGGVNANSLNFLGGGGGDVFGGPSADNIFPDFLGGGSGGDAGPGFGFFDQSDADGVLTQQGILSPALKGIGGAFNIYSGLKALGIQEDTLDFQKKAFKKNFAANKAAFQENLRSKFGRKKALGGHKGTSEQQFVDKRSDF
jgi:hypothetical protein